MEYSSQCLHEGIRDGILGLVSKLSPACHGNGIVNIYIFTCQLPNFEFPFPSSTQDAQEQAPQQSSSTPSIHP
jgi:hypothetical protein